MKLTVLKNENILFNDYAQSVSITTDEGEAQILPDHQPLLTKIHNSVSYVDKNNNCSLVEFSVGFMYTNGAETVVVTE